MYHMEKNNNKKWFPTIDLFDQALQMGRNQLINYATMQKLRQILRLRLRLRNKQFVRNMQAL